MDEPQLPRETAARLARQARTHFVTQAQAVIAPMGLAVRTRLAELTEMSRGSQDMYERRDALMDFDKKGGDWQKGILAAWKKAVMPATATGRIRLDQIKLELIGDDVVENKIMSGRLALAIQENTSIEVHELMARMQHLEGVEEPASTDILRTEALVQLVIEQWTAAGLSRDVFAMVQDIVQRQLTGAIPQAYISTNEFLIARDVLRDIDLAARIKRAASTPSQPRPDNAQGNGYPGGAGGGGSGSGSGSGQQATGSQAGAARSMDSRQGGGVSDETRMMTTSPPLARARARASGVLGQLKRLLTEKVIGFDGPPASRPSPELAEALQQQHTTQMAVDGAATAHQIVVYDDAAVQEIAVDLRKRTGELKKKANTQTEKATIEIVALMFQSILSEERIPPAIRVWFARLQMPVLRLAIAEPEFFGSLDHPARQLIDRMGSCVMGFDAATIGGSTLEVEIKRVVQVIEQYPETGRRVFQLVYDEFQKFLSRFLTEGGPTQKLVSVAQQVEQKETLVIQYTIELRAMLKDMPMRDEIREFLFKIWAEVLAVSAVKNGPQHADTLALKSSASELVWAASAKPNRAERAKVIAELPRLLQRLRQGMTLIGIQGKDQEAHIKAIGDTLADAFLAKTDAIPQQQIDAMAKRLANLEDFVADDPNTDLPLDSETIEMMLGIDASMIEVVADGGSRPSVGMLSWAQELQLGNWFALDHNGATTQVQYVWRSERKQLHLFAAPGGRSFLVQLRRVAAYLQAGLLLPAEEEALTVRATRDALAKLDANPERLLQ